MDRLEVRGGVIGGGLRVLAGVINGYGRGVRVLHGLLREIRLRRWRGPLSCPFALTAWDIVESRSRFFASALSAAQKRIERHGHLHTSPEKTRQAWMEGKPVENPSARPAQKLPKDAKHVGQTMIVTVDGTGVPCTHEWMMDYRTLRKLGYPLAPCRLR